MKIIIDNGHGVETPGKGSPDGRLREWAYNRRLGASIADALARRGRQVHMLVPEDRDIPLGERCARANGLCGAGDAVLVSIHVNASACTGWHEPRGWSAFVCPGASASSQRLARDLTAAARARGLLGNRATPPCGFWTASLAICRGTRCPAVLTENMFMDNRADVDFLLSEHGLAALTAVHVEALERFCTLRS